MHHHHHQSNFDLLNGGGRIYPSSNLSNSHSLSRSIHGALFSYQRSCSPSPFASSMSYLLVLASSCPSLQTPTVFSERAHHPSSTHACTILLYSLFPSILTSPSGPLFSFSPSVLHHTLLSLSLSRSFLKLPSHFPSNTMSHSHVTLICAF